MKTLFEHKKIGRVSKALVRHSLRKRKSREFEEARFLIGRMAGRVGLVSNLVLSSVKVVLGLLIHSLALVGDGLNNLSDAAASIMTLIGFRISAKEPDEDHPYGHGRVEYLLSGIVAIFIFYAGFSLLHASVSRLLSRQSEVVMSPAAMIFLALSVLLKLWLWHLYGTLGKAIHSDMLKAASLDSLSDAAAGLCILVALPLSAYLKIQADAWLSIAISLLIVRAGWEVMRNSTDKILGGQPNHALLERIKHFLQDKPGVLGYHDLRIHDYGPGRTYVTVDAEVDGSRNVMDIHDDIEAIEFEAGEKLGVQLSIHIDPVLLHNPRYRGLKAVVEDALRQLSPDYRYHDLLVRNRDAHPNIIFDLLVPADEKRSNHEIADRVAEALTERLPYLRPLIRVERNFLDI